MIDYFEETNSNLVEDKFRELLRATLEEYDPKVAVHEDRASTRKLNRYLQRATEGMRSEIMRFLTTYAGLTSAQSAKTTAFLMQSAKWNISDRKTAAKEVENMVYNIAKVYPNKLLTGSFSSSIPKHWSFSSAHQLFLEKATEEFYKKLAALPKDATFQKFIKTVASSTKDLVLFMEQIPVFEPVIKEGVEYWSLYSDETAKLLQEYCLLSVLHEYIVVANDREFVQMRTEEISVNPTLDEGDEDYGTASQIQQIRIVESDAAELKKMVGAFLIAMIDRERETKNAMNYNYAEIMEKTMGLKQKDKKSITDYLGGLSRDDRRVGQALRSHKIGRWNVGMQKGLYQYDKGVYDKEIGQWHLGQESEDGVLGQDVEDLAREEEAQQSADYNDGDGWENLNEDYMDGIYYEEDAEREEYDEY